MSAWNHGTLVDIIAQIIVARTYESYYQILECHNSIIALIIASYYETILIIALIIASYYETILIIARIIARSEWDFEEITGDSYIVA